jgi:hypothetical protein
VDFNVPPFGDIGAYLLDIGAIPIDLWKLPNAPGKARGLVEALQSSQKLQ